MKDFKLKDLELKNVNPNKFQSDMLFWRGNYDSNASYATIVNPVIHPLNPRSYTHSIFNFISMLSADPHISEISWNGGTPLNLESITDGDALFKISRIISTIDNYKFRITYRENPEITVSFQSEGRFINAPFEAPITIQFGKIPYTRIIVSSQIHIPENLRSLVIINPDVSNGELYGVVSKQSVESIIEQTKPEISRLEMINALKAKSTSFSNGQNSRNNGRNGYSGLFSVDNSKNS